MTYRGVYRDGIVVLQGDVNLRNGETVDVSPARKAGSGTKAKSGARTKKKAAKSASSKHPLPGFGSWKHRTDIVDSREFARALRGKASTRRSSR